jgi:hypothetical protein
VPATTVGAVMTIPVIGIGAGTDVVDLVTRCWMTDRHMASVLAEAAPE